MDQKKVFKFAQEVTLLGGLMITPALMAQESDMQVAESNGELAPYVVVSTRTPLGLERISPSVSYISAEEMELWQDRSLVGVLEKEPGMVLITSGGTGAQSSLFTRGTESNHTAFFMNGRRLNSGFGNQYDLELLSIGNLSSVQIQRGASSVNYGSSGIGGVVDLQMQSALELEAPGGSLEAEYGANGYLRGAFTASVAADELGFTVSGSKLNTDNERVNDAYETENWTSRLDYRLSDELSLELLGQFTESDKELPNTVTSPKLEDVQNTKNWLISPGVRYATDELSLHAFYSRSRSEALLNQVKGAFGPFPLFTYLGDFPVSNRIQVDTDELNLQLDYSVTDDLLLTTGFLYRKDEASNSNLNTFNPLDPAIPYAENFEQVGLYAQALWLIGDLELRGGVRYDDYSDYDSQTTGSFEVVYALEDINASLFAKVATSYAPPGATDIAFDSDATTALNAEESLSFELGFRQAAFNEKMEYSLMLFRSEIDELLSFDPLTYDTYNVEKATTEGLEFSLDYAVCEKLSVALGYTYLTAVADRLDDPHTPYWLGSDPANDVRLARRARHVLQLFADYRPTDALHVGLQAIGHFDREDIDPVSFLQVDAEDFFVVRFVVDWAITDEVTVFARAENLLDESYAPAAGFPALGRAGYIGARWSF